MVANVQICKDITVEFFYTQSLSTICQKEFPELSFARYVLAVGGATSEMVAYAAVELLYLVALLLVVGRIDTLKLLKVNSILIYL